MIKVRVGNNVDRCPEFIVPDTTTLREAVSRSGIDLSHNVTNVNGHTIQGDDWDKTFADFGITEKARIFGVVKMDNA